MPAKFFDESTEQSKAKAEIVSKYFWAWQQVIIPTVRKSHGKIAYIDLFAGPGRYKDGTKSTPLLVLERAIGNPELQQRLVTIFNDVDSDNSQSLKKAIEEIPGIEKLKYPPEIDSQEIGQDIVKSFEKNRLVPTLFFVDPWGYKGLSLRLVNSVLKDWGCDCIFFFNYNRINMGLSNEIFDEHMNALFEKDRADALRIRLAGLNSAQRELAIVEEIAQALKAMGGRYVLPFRFKNNEGNRTSHHLIFVSKNFKGYEIMKNIMAKESSKADQGVPSFEYNPSDIQNPLLFELTRPLDDLAESLLNRFAGETHTVDSIYKQHNVGTPYILKNYKTVLKQLETTGAVVTDPPASKRRMQRGEVTIGDTVRITFPSRSS